MLVLTSFSSTYRRLAVRNILVAMIAFMPTPGEGAVAALEYSADERKYVVVAVSLNAISIKISADNVHL
jgi:hypothetical protein